MIRELFVIGGGSAGVRSARISSASGVKVTLAEKRTLGGTCVHRGCIPKKLMAYAGEARRNILSASKFGFSLRGNEALAQDHKQLMATIRKELTRLEGVYQDLLSNNGVETLKGTATLVGDSKQNNSRNSSSKIKVKCNGKLYLPDAVIVAGGMKPNRLTIPGGELAKVSDDIFFEDTLPPSIAIIGGGYIALEFACIMNNLGSKVTILHRSDKFLRRFDQECVEFALVQMEKDGITIHRNFKLESLATDADAMIKINGSKQVRAHMVLNATGRITNSDELGLDDAKVATNPQGEITVDENYLTSQENIYALGDVIGQGQLTPLAIAQAKRWHKIHILGQSASGQSASGQSGQAAVAAERLPRLEDTPSAVFTTPQMSFLGDTEEALRQEYGQDLEVRKTSFRPLKETLAPASSGRSLIKLMARKSDGVVLALHMVGDDSAEIVQGFAAALKKQITLDELNSIIGTHPTAGEEIFTL